MSDTVIKVENISKFYQLGLINHGTLAKDLQGWWAKIRGKEDPNSRISMLSSAKNNSDNDFIYALKDVSFDVKQGEVLGIIGANGAGKSTLLKILSRVTSPTSGCIKIKGRIGSLLEVGTGFHPELTGRENIYLNGAILGMRKHEIDRKLDEIIDFSGVEKFIDTPVKRYSSGMYVRLAFAVAAHLDPEILVVDEVLAVGDADFQKKALGKMQDVSRGEGRTVLFVSHNMAAVKSLCKKGLILENGMIKETGDVDTIVGHYLKNDSDLNNHKLWSASSVKFDGFELLEIGIRKKDGQYEDVMSVNDDLELHIRYKLDRYFKSIYPSFHFKNDQGNKIFVSYGAGRCFPYEHESGEYEQTVLIPKNFLNWGNFYIDLLISNGQKTLKYEDDVISFSLSNGIGKLGIWMGRLAGDITPSFDFVEKKLS